MSQNKTYFSLYQENDYLSTGMNSVTKKDAVDAAIDYAMNGSDLTKKEIKLLLALPIEEQENYLSVSMNITIDEHNEKLVEA